MRILGVERICLEVKDLAASITQFAELFATEFHRRDLLVDTTIKHLAFSSMGIELYENESIEKEHLRSFHIRVDHIDEVPEHVVKANGTILSTFQVGQMKHVATQIGDFRILFVEYEGDEPVKSLVQEETNQGE